MANPKHAIVTGGTQGIGLAIAQGLAANGYLVRAIGLEASSDLHHEAITFVEMDVTDDVAVDDLLSGTESLDTLVNAAGIIARQEEFELKTFTRVLDVNLTAAMRLSTAARSALSRAKGNIVNIASMLSFFGGGLVPAYSASKGGVVQLTKSLAIAWADDQIRVNAIAPGWIETAMTDQLRDNAARNAEILGRTPMKRWGKPEEIVGPVLFLTSPAASFVTGCVMTVDGGYSCV